MTARPENQPQPVDLLIDAWYVVTMNATRDIIHRGSVAVNGNEIVAVAPQTPRAERVAIRMASGGPMRRCVKSGYVIGGDPETHRKANAALLAFLGRALAG